MALREETMDIIKATAPVLAEHGTTITTVFYKKMFTENPELLNIFNKTNQSKGKQQEALANMVYQAAVHIDRLENIIDDVSLVAEKHRALNILPEHYPIVGKHLLFAIKEVLGDAATDEIMAAWEETYGVLANVFIEAEEKLYVQAEEAAGGWRGFKEFVLEKKVAESDVITSFYLKPKDESKVPSYVAGQYLTVRVKPEGAEHKQIRHYTLSTKPNEDYFRISVKKEDVFETNGVVSCHLHDHVHEGDTVEVSAPAGLFTLEEDDQAPIALVSGGVGITPMISMLDQLVAENSNRHVTFLHAAQNENLHAFHEDVQAMTDALENGKYVYGYDRAINPDGDQDFNGFISKDVLANIHQEGMVYYVVGPVPMMAHVANLLVELGIPKENIKYELFGPKEEIFKEVAYA
ncbi:MAG TPA: NO-inducible flavohemoprotein [Pseudogracilibacillus sp.]|nr:NO-inducible flavohemoprotein [Pseudogracilibacillus sp.]